MTENTKIEWADHTFNPWIGCTKVSPGCDHCYLGVAWGPHTQRRRTAASTWQQPLTWNRRAEREGRRYRVFCASLADVFDNQVDPEWRADLWTLIGKTPHLDWLLLTKRPQNIAKMLPGTDSSQPGYRPWNRRWPWPNVWLGTTVENQAEADRRIPHLLAVPAAKHFLSCEPLLGPVDLSRWIEPIDHCNACGAEHPPQVDDECPKCGAKNHLISTWGHDEAERYRTGERWSLESELGCGDVNGTNPSIDWVISGGESGTGARPSHPDWHRSLRDQCAEAGVPFLFKQWGEWTAGNAIDPDGFADHLCCIDAEGRDVSLSRSADDAAKCAPWWRLMPGSGFWAPGPIPQGTIEVRRVGKKAAGRLLDGQQHDGVPTP